MILMISKLLEDACKTKEWFWFYKPLESQHERDCGICIWPYSEYAYVENEIQLYLTLPRWVKKKNF